MKKIVFCLLCVLCGCSSSINSDVTPTTAPLPTPTSTPDLERHFSLVAVGDNLIHGAVYKAAYNASSDTYDFNDMYALVKPIVEPYDLAYVNLETLAAGQQFGLSNYPNFNGPLEIIDGIVNAGFDWLSISSNHSLDRGVEGIMSQTNYIRDHFNVITTGVNLSQKEANEYQVININGINVGLLGYTYGLNGHQLPQEYDYLINVLTKDKLVNDIYEISKISDIQLVSVHWGDEYQYQPNQYQKELALAATKAGADVIVGTHPHVIQPLEILRQDNGSETVVMYSLGNFLSAQDRAARMLEAMLQLDIGFNIQTKQHWFNSINVTPLINHVENGWTYFQVTPWQDYDDSKVNSHTLTIQGEDMSREYLANIWNSVYPNYPIESWDE